MFWVVLEESGLYSDVLAIFDIDQELDARRFAAESSGKLRRVLPVEAGQLLSQARQLESDALSTVDKSPHIEITEARRKAREKINPPPRSGR